MTRFHFVMNIADLDLAKRFRPTRDQIKKIKAWPSRRDDGRDRERLIERAIDATRLEQS